MSKIVKQERDQWKKPADFILSLLGYIIGLGNLWRFPYICHKNGGGAFLIPYLLSVAFITLPMYIFEIGLGQLTGRAKLDAWNRVPIMKGIGYSAVVLTVLAMIPYMLIMGWAVLFFWSSLTGNSLPWATCGNPWNTPNCVSRFEENMTMISNYTSNNTEYVTESISQINITNKPDVYLKTSLSQVQFWRNYVLRIPNSDSDLNGAFNWPMMLSLFAAFLTVFLITVKGIKSSGKAVYFTATFPYVMLVILLIRGVTLEGAGEGIKQFLLPDFSRLASGEVWIDAASQSMWSFAVGYSGLTAFGGYNKRNNDFIKQSLFLLPIGMCTSIFMGIVTFSILGHMAHIEKVPVEEVAFSGPGLVFQVFPAGLALMPFPQIWSLLFFLMLFMVAIDSAFSEFEGLMAIIGDSYPLLISTQRRRALTNASLLTTFFVACLCLLSPHGIYIFELINYYGSSGICVVFCILAESLAVGWLWDGDKFAHEVYEATGRRLSPWFKFSYRAIVPFLCLAISIFYCVKWKPLTVGDFVYPTWGYVVGWFLSLLSLLCIPGYILYILFREKGTLKQRWKNGLKPNKFSNINATNAEDKLETEELHNLNA